MTSVETFKFVLNVVAFVIGWQIGNLIVFLIRK
jgi:hypothetical protein